MQAAWLIRSRQMATDFRFWLAITGYNPRDRSLSQRIYLVYAAIFFSIWGFAVLSLLAGVVASLLTRLNPGAPMATAADLLGILLLGWGLLRLNQAARRSPIPFNETDSYLICLTPAERGGVALAWFPGIWIYSALPFWAIAVTCGFARVEILRAGSATLADAPFYILNGLQALVIVLFLQAGLLAWIWASGAYRLQPGRGATRLRMAAPLLAGIALIVGLLAIALPGAAAWAIGIWRGLIFPLLAAFGSGPWLAGAIVVAALCFAGLTVLRSTAAGMSLSQAARESTGQEPAGALAILGPSDTHAQLRDQQRVGSASSPSRLPDRPGEGALIWKQGIRTQRTFRLGDLGPWLLLVFTLLAGFLLPGLAPRLYALVVWTLIAGQQACAPLRRHMMQWWLFRQLPFSSQRILATEVGPAVGLVTLLTWLCAALSLSIPTETRIAIALAAPGAAAAAALAGALDITRQAKSGALISGIVPEEGALGVLLGMIGPGLTVLLISVLSNQPGTIWLAGILGLVSSLLLAYLYWQLAAQSLRRIG